MRKTGIPSNRWLIPLVACALYIAMSTANGAVLIWGTGIWGDTWAGNNTDIDGDGISDSLDNCVFDVNADQLNTDSDTMGNVCDADDDNDELADTEEQTYGTNPLLADTDRDGVTDKAELIAGRDPTINEAVIILLIENE